MNIGKNLIVITFFVAAGSGMQIRTAGKENIAQPNGRVRYKITNIDMDLSSAAHFGKLQAVRDSLNKGANPNMPVGNYTLFEDTFDLAFPAAKSSRILRSVPNQIEVLKELAKHGGNIKDLNLDAVEAHYFDKTGKPIKALFASEDVAAEYRKTIDFLKGFSR